MADLVPTVRLFGDRLRARELVGFAMQQLEITKTLMGFQELKQYKRRTTLPGGSVILCKVTFGISVVDIFVPPVPVGPEEDPDRFDVATLMPFWFKYLPSPAQQAHSVVAYSEWKEKPPYRAKIHAKPKLYTGPDFTIPISDVFRGEHPESGNALIGNVESYTWRVLPKPEDADPGYSIGLFRWQYFKIFEGHLVYFGQGKDNALNLRRSGLIVARNTVANKTEIMSDGCIASNFYLYEDGSFDVFGLRETRYTFDLFITFYLFRHNRKGEVIETISAWGEYTAGVGNYQTQAFSIAFDGSVYYTDFPLHSAYQINNWPPGKERTIVSMPSHTYGYDPMLRVMVEQQAPKFIDQSKGLTWAPSGSPTYGSYPNCQKSTNGGTVSFAFRRSLSSGVILEWTRTLSGGAVKFWEYYPGKYQAPNFYCDWNDERLSRTAGGTIGGTETLTETRDGEIALLNRKAVSFYDWTLKKWIILDEVMLYDETRTTRLASGNWWECPGEWVVDFQRVETYQLRDGITGDVVYEYVSPLLTWTSSSPENYFACAQGDDTGDAFYESWGDIPPLNYTIPASKRIECLRDLRLVTSLGAYLHDGRINEAVFFRQDYRNSLDLLEPEVSASVSIPQGGKQSLILPVKEWRLLANSSLLGVTGV